MLLGIAGESRRTKGQPSTGSQGLQYAGALYSMVSCGLQIVHPHQYSVIEHVSSRLIQNRNSNNKKHRQNLLLVAMISFFCMFLLGSGASLIKLF